MRLQRGLRALLVAAALSAASTMPAQAASPVFAGHSGWFWANPLPQGNTLRAIDFAGSRGYAVGDFGTVIRTDDGGTTWSGITTGTTTPLRLVRIISPDALVVAGKCEVRRSDDAGQRFKALPWAPPGSACRSPIRAVFFPTSQIGYLILADGRTLRSQDGGQSWAARTAIPGTTAFAPGSTVRPTDAFFTSGSTGFVTTSAGSILRTTDGGTSWSPVATAPEGLNSIVFTDAKTAIAVGGTLVVTSKDGGQTWTQRSGVAQPESFAQVRCADNLGCIATTTAGDMLLRTADGGQTWTPISPATHALFAAAYSTSQHLVASGNAGTMVESTDGGNNFRTISGQLTGAFTLVRSTAPLVAYGAGKSGLLAMTTDGGSTWMPLAPPVAGDIIDLSFPTGSTGFALAKDNVLMRTDNGAVTWSVIDPGTFVPARAVVATDPDNIMLVMQRGLRRSSDGGLNFTRVRAMPVATATLTGGGRAGPNLYAYGPRALLISADGGRNWRPKAVPVGEHFRKVDLVSPRVGYALTTDGRAWRTLDGAHTWQQMPGLGTELGADIVFGDVREGYVSVPQFGSDSGGYVMRTTDGGTTWRPQLVDSKPIRPGALAADGGATAYAVAGGNHLLGTNRGGDIGRTSKLTLSIPRARPGKPGVLAIKGTLTPAQGGEAVVVSKREGRSSRWLYRVVTVAASGRFTAFTNVTRTTSFVAQWTGDDELIGAGTPAVTVGIGRRYMRRTP